MLNASLSGGICLVGLQFWRYMVIYDETDGEWGATSKGQR